MRAAAQVTPELVASPLELARAVTRIDSSPAVLLRLNRLYYVGLASADELGYAVRHDPGLALGLLRRDNQFGAKSASVEAAIDHFGIDLVREWVGAIVDEQILVKPLSLYGRDAEEHWRRSVACALAAKCLAERVGLDPQVAYTAGLLHAVGMVAIDTWVTRAGPALMLIERSFPHGYSEGERALLGTTQAEVGAALLREWGMPDCLVEAVRWQDAPESGDAMAGLLNAAKWVAAAGCADENDEPLSPPAAVAATVAFLEPQADRFVMEIRIRLDRLKAGLETEPARPAQEAARGHASEMMGKALGDHFYTV